MRLCGKFCAATSMGARPSSKLLVVPLLLLWVLAGASAPGAEVRVVDDWDRTLSLEGPARRVVPLYGAFSEMLFAMGAGEQVVARTRADHHPPGIRSLPSVGTHMRPNVEMVLGLKPDLVVQSASRRAATAEMDRLQHAGIPVAVFHPDDFPSIYSTIGRLGVLTGRSEEASAVVDGMRRRLDRVARKLASRSRRPRVFFEVRGQPLTAAGRGSVVDEIITAAGGENVVRVERSMVRFDLEALLLEDPDYYIVQQGPMNRNPMEPSRRPHYSRLAAVKEGRVLWVDESIFSRPGPRCVEAVEKLASALHPDAFSGSSPSLNPPPSAESSPAPPSGTGEPPREKLRWETVRRSLLLPLARLVFFIAIGLLAGNVIEALGWTRPLGRVAGPFLRWGRLGNHSGVAFMSAFFSGVTANTMLMNAYREEKLSRRELYFASMVNTLPSYFLHLPTTFFILLPLVKTAGALYLGVTLGAALLRTVALLLAGRWALPAPSSSWETKSVQGRRKKVLADAWRKFKKRFVKILLLTLPIYTAFFFLNHYGFFRWMEEMVARVVVLRAIPLEALSVVVFQAMAEFAAGAAAAGALLDAGTLTVKATVLALLAGNLISTPVRALRHQLPHYMGIYTPSLGLSLLVVNQAVRVASVLAAAVLFYVFYPG